MKRSSVPSSLMALSATLVPLAAPHSLPAADAAAPAAKSSGIEDFIKQSKQPTPWLSWGGDLRVRDEYMDSVLTLASGDYYDFNVIRTRGRVWTSITPVADLSLNARLSAEPRTFTTPAGYGPYRGTSGTEWRYGMVDNLNVKWTNVLSQPLSVTAGRQDIAFGDYWNWWLVADGTPGDGSWTYFLDSVRVGYEAKEIKTKFDLIYIYQNARADEWLPTITDPSYHGTDYPLTEQNEQGVIAYASNKSIKDTTLDAYFIYKRDTQETFSRGGARWVPGDNANMYTMGARWIGTYGEHWQPYLEGAYQLGNKEDTILGKSNAAGTFADRDLRAYGVNAKLSYLFKDRLNNQFQILGEHLSGDNPDTTGTDEMFDILWGRWPRWSEMYIYSYASETSGKIAQLNNITRVGGGWSISPMKGMTFTTIYNALFAPENTPTRRVDINPAVAGVQSHFSTSGNFRGHYLQAVLKHQFSKHVNAHLWAETVWQGDYYSEREVMVFLRPEIMFTY